MVLYSTLLHLPPFRFHCVGEYWDWTHDCCDSCHWQSGVPTTLPDLNFTCNLMRNYSMPVGKYCLEFQNANDVLKEKICNYFLVIISVSPTRPNISCYSEFYKWPKANPIYTSISLPKKMYRTLHFSKKMHQANHQNSLENRFAPSPPL